MNKKEKKKEIAYLKKIFLDNNIIILCKINNLNSSETYKLRKKMRSNDINIRIVKNKLAKIAIKNTKMLPLRDDFNESTAIVWSNDEILPAKILIEAQKIMKISIKSGYAQNNKMSLNQIKQLALMPNLEESKLIIINTFIKTYETTIFQINFSLHKIIYLITTKYKI
jgi:large subunit ribosomal protein L10